MNDMDDSMDIVERALGSSLKRRDFLTKAAAAGAIAWSVPVILSRPAGAADSGGGSPGCQPTFTLTCETYNCGQNKGFPGFRVNGLATCPCQHAGCQTAPTACVRISCLTPGLVAYANGTDCGSVANGGVDVPVSTGCWESFMPSMPIFFGPVRSGGGTNPKGAIPALGSSICVSFRVSIWAGGCCDNAGNPAFTCRTFNVVLDWNQNGNVTTCTGTTAQCGALGFTPAPPAQSCCPTTNPQLSPCASSNPNRCAPCPPC